MKLQIFELLGTAEADDGGCGTCLLVISYLLICITFPFSLILCIKVSFQNVFLSSFHLFKFSFQIVQEYERAVHVSVWVV